jgi:hypothetical protein
MLLVVSCILGALIVAVIAVVALLGWGGLLSLTQRLGLASIGAGILWAGPARAWAGSPALATCSSWQAL